MVFWRAVFLHCRKFRRIVNDLEGLAPDRPKIGLTKRFALPKRRINSALKNFVINHWLKASGMNVWFDNATESKPCYGLQSVVDDEETERRL